MNALSEQKPRQRQGDKSRSAAVGSVFRIPTAGEYRRSNALQQAGEADNVVGTIQLTHSTSLSFSVQSWKGLRPRHPRGRRADRAESAAAQPPASRMTECRPKGCHAAPEWLFWAAESGFRRRGLAPLGALPKEEGLPL